MMTMDMAEKHRIELDTITAHRLVCGRRASIIVVMYEMHWKGFTRVFREREADDDLQHFSPAALRRWTGHPIRRGAGNKAYHRIRKRAFL